MQFDDTGARRTRRGAAGARAVVRAGVAWTWLLLAAALPLPVQAVPADSERPRAFDIPAQPLPQALQLYGESTGVAVLIDAHLLGGLRSTPVHGEFAPLPALQRLLQGTGLSPRFVDGGAFTLTPDAAPTAAAAAVAAPPPPALSAAAQRQAARVIQHSLEQALCSARLTRPGSYRATLQLWIEPGDPRVREATMLQGSGDAARDAAIVARLRGMVLAGLPADLPQPVSLLLAPRTAASTPPCRGVP